MRTYYFWKKKSLLAFILLPLGILYKRISIINYQLRTKFISEVPIISIGSPVIQGGGKTPTVQALAKFFKDKKKVAILASGYKGNIKESMLVLQSHTAYDVGDEALMLSSCNDTFISKNRVKGLQYIGNDYEMIITDGGYYDTSVVNKMKFLVIDGATNIKNDFPFPAGPIISDINSAFGQSDAIILLNKGKLSGSYLVMINKYKKPIIHTHIKYRTKYSKKENRLLFSGIGQSNKFESSITENNFKIEESFIYPDHYQYSQKDVNKLYEIAMHYEKYTLITTEKDYVRLNDINDPGSKLRNIIDIFQMEITFEGEGEIEKILRDHKLI